jgi:hypothetical protein
MPDRHEGKLDNSQNSAQWKVVGVIARVVLMRMGVDARRLAFTENWSWP